MDDDFIPNDQDPKRLTNRNDRIEYLVNLIKALLENEKDHNKVIQIVNNKITSLWSPSIATRKSYLDDTTVALKERYNIELKQNLQLKPSSKEQTIIRAIREMQEDDGDAEENALLDRLIVDGFSDKTQAETYLEKMHRFGRIYKPKLGFYRIV